MKSEYTISSQLEQLLFNREKGNIKIYLALVLLLIATGALGEKELEHLFSLGPDETKTTVYLGGKKIGEKTTLINPSGNEITFHYKKGSSAPSPQCSNIYAEDNPPYTTIDETHHAISIPLIGPVHELPTTGEITVRPNGEGKYDCFFPDEKGGGTSVIIIEDITPPSVTKIEGREIYIEDATKPRILDSNKKGKEPAEKGKNVGQWVITLVPERVGLNHINHGVLIDEGGNKQKLPPIRFEYDPAKYVDISQITTYLTPNKNKVIISVKGKTKRGVSINTEFNRSWTVPIISNLLSPHSGSNGEKCSTRMNPQELTFEATCTVNRFLDKGKLYVKITDKYGLTSEIKREIKFPGRNTEREWAKFAGEALLPLLAVTVISYLAYRNRFNTLTKVLRRESYAKRLAKIKRQHEQTPMPLLDLWKEIANGFSTGKDPDQREALRIIQPVIVNSLSPKRKEKGTITSPSEIKDPATKLELIYNPGLKEIRDWIKWITGNNKEQDYLLKAMSTPQNLPLSKEIFELAVLFSFRSSPGNIRNHIKRILEIREVLNFQPQQLHFFLSESIKNKVKNKVPYLATETGRRIGEIIMILLAWGEVDKALELINNNSLRDQTLNRVNRGQQEKEDKKSIEKDINTLRKIITEVANSIVEDIVWNSLGDPEGELIKEEKVMWRLPKEKIKKLERLKPLIEELQKEAKKIGVGLKNIPKSDVCEKSKIQTATNALAEIEKALRGENHNLINILSDSNSLGTTIMVLQWLLSILYTSYPGTNRFKTTLKLAKKVLAVSAPQKQTDEGIYKKYKELEGKVKDIEDRYTL